MNIYIIKAEGTDYYKIGVAENTSKRLMQISTNSPFKTEIIFELKSDISYYIEQKIHTEYKNKNTNNEWFELSKNDIDIIKSKIVTYSNEINPKEILIDWLNEYKEFFSLRAIETKLEIPRDTLQKFSQGKQSIPNKWVSVLLNFFMEMFAKLKYYP